MLRRLARPRPGAPTRARNEDGSGAVEFALLSSLFFAMLFGILDYGLWFSDSSSARQAVRDSAREGVVGNFTACGGKTAELDKLRCTTNARVATVTGPSYVRITAPSGWVRGKPLTVCTLIDSDGVVGLAPLPNSGIVVATTSMAIESVTTTPSVTTSADTLPSGLNWNLCS